MELVPEVTGVEDVERLEEEAKFPFLAPIEELRNADVQLREAVTALGVERQLVLIVHARINRIAVVVHAIAIDVTADSARGTL